MRLTQIDVPGRDLSGLTDEAAKRSNERAREKDPDDEGEQDSHDEHQPSVESRVVRGPRVCGERHREDVAPRLVHQSRDDAALLGGAGAERERGITTRAARQSVESGLERRERIDDELVRCDRAEPLVRGELLRRVRVDRRDRLVDERLGLRAIALGFRDRETDPVVIDKEGVRADADGAGVALDDVPDGGEVHARANDRDDDIVRRDRGREEERGFVGDNRIRGVAHVGRALHRGEEVLAEGDARALVGRHGGGDDGALGVHDGDGFVLGRSGGGRAERCPRGAARVLVAEVCRVSDDVRELGDKDDVAEAAGEVCVDRVRCRGGALADVRHAERGQIVTCVVRGHDADQGDRRHADDHQRRENLLPEPNTRPTHTLPCPARLNRPPVARVSASSAQ